MLIRGGQPLHGAVRASGSKNASLPILCAALLNEQPVAIHGVPELHDVTVIGEVLRSVGAGFARPRPNHTIHVDASDAQPLEPSYELVNKMRASFLVLGPLLARFGEARVPLPGGCELGARPVGEHLAALRALGAEIKQEGGLVIARAQRLTGSDVYLDIVSVGATENTVMAAALAEGTTVIYNAAEEPEVVDLCRFLQHCGVELEGAGTNTITVHGQKRISAAVDYAVIPDRLEAGTYLLAIVGTGGTGTVAGAKPEHLEAVILKLRECGVQLEVDQSSITVRNAARLKPVSIRTAVYPGFPTDLQPQITAVLTRADGVSTVTETIFERRMSHVPELARMGAQIQLSGDSAIVTGESSHDVQAGVARSTLTGAPVEAHDIRCSAALVIAGLMAQGDTRLHGLQHLLRGYEQLPEKLAGLGAEARFVDGEEAAAESSAQ
jgi:UDP-N-acetylglucosamine 1-carboxyvinyltransferase